MGEHRKEDKDGRKDEENSFSGHRLSAAHWVVWAALIFVISVLYLCVYLLGDDGIGHNIVVTPMANTLGLP